MPVNDAISWLSAHSGSIPALDQHHKNAITVLNRKTSTLVDLANIIQLDPGMSLALYTLVNGKLERIDRQRVTDIRSALGLLGQGAISDFVSKQKKLSEIYPDKQIQRAYHQLVSRSHDVLNQALGYLRIQGIKPTDEIRSAALLYFIGEMTACLFDFQRYQSCLSQFAPGFTDPARVNSVFKFEFAELGLLLADKNTLPTLLVESLSLNPQTSRKARSINLAANISLQTESGWDSPAFQSSLDTAANFLSITDAEFRTKVQTMFIDSARSCPVGDVFPAAAGLILMLPGRALVSPVTQPVAKKGPLQKPPFKILIKTYLKSGKASLSQLMSLFINHIHDDLGFSQVLIMLLSQDKTSIITQLSKGLPADSAMLGFKFETAQYGLVNAMLSRPQALFMNKANIKKYEQELPHQLKSVSQSKEYILMSLFIAEKPLGLIYCDRTNSSKILDQETYSLFKASVLMTDKAYS